MYISGSVPVQSYGSAYMIPSSPLSYSLQATVVFFQRYFGKELTLEERMEFVNFWYILICINDILIIMGSFLKIGLESKVRR